VKRAFEDTRYSVVVTKAPRLELERFVESLKCIRALGALSDYRSCFMV
jgi:hypothetical protein